jgi:hypothetical protein
MRRHNHPTKPSPHHTAPKLSSQAKLGICCFLPLFFSSLSTFNFQLSTLDFLCGEYPLLQKTKRLRPISGPEPFACVEVQIPVFPAQKSPKTKPHRKSEIFGSHSPPTARILVTASRQHHTAFVVLPVNFLSVPSDRPW